MLIPRHLHKKKSDQAAISFSQFEQATMGGEQGVGGRVGGIPLVHIVRAWHHLAVPISWPVVVHCIAHRLPFLQHSVELFAILRPLS